MLKRNFDEIFMEMEITSRFLRLFIYYYYFYRNYNGFRVGDVSIVEEDSFMYEDYIDLEVEVLFLEEWGEEWRC